MFKLFILVISLISFKANATELATHSAFVDKSNMYITILGDACSSHNITLQPMKDCVEGVRSCFAKLQVVQTAKGCGPGVKAYTKVIKRSALGLPESLKKLVIAFNHLGHLNSYELIMSKSRKLGLINNKGTLYVSAKNCNYLRPKLTVADECRSDRQNRNESPFCHASLSLDDSDGDLPCSNREKEFIVSKISLRESRVDKKADWLIITHKTQEYTVPVR